MSLFDEGSDKLLSIAFKMPSQKDTQVIKARRLCKALGISFATIDKTAEGKNALIEQVVERYIELNPQAFDKVKGLLPSKALIADEISYSRPKTTYAMDATVRGMAY